MFLGDLITRLDSDDEAALALDGIGDVVLYTEVAAMGAHFDETPGEYVANAARRFAALASNEDWLALMSAIEASEDPASTAIGRMIRWALGVDAGVSGPCGCSGETPAQLTTSKSP